MKKIILILITILSISPNVYSQNTEICFNKGLGFELGYSNMYNTINDGIVEPKHLLNADLTVCWAYIGMAIGTKCVYHEADYYSVYTEHINTFIVRGGPVIRIGNYKHGVNITPYIGAVWNNFNTEYEDYYNPYYYGYSKYIYTNNYTYSKSFLYGIRATYTYNYFSISGNISNHDVGVSIGFYIPM